MMSTRLPVMLRLVLLAGTAGGCIGEGVPATDESAALTNGLEPSATSVSPTWVADPSGPTLFQHVTDYARSRAGTRYLPPDTIVTRTVSELTYGHYRGIRFRSENAIWRDVAPFELQLFHPGAGNDTPVRIHLVEDGSSRLLAFDASLFDYGDELDGVDIAIPPEAGYAGLRVLFPLNDAARMDEVVSFLGASYFRLLGPGHVYGLSSRGLAVDVARPEGEEFPDFREFWLVRPEESATSLELYAFLDGPSVTGAYRFGLTPGGVAQPTVMAIEARLFARVDVQKVGVAPLTSMYLHGTFHPGGDDDFRPRVHDSEGLLMNTGTEEWIWRPLTNGSGLRLTSLRDEGPAGFGLVQRARDFGGYMDLESLYHRRPSQWVAIDEPWGAGGVELLEIPTTNEFNDNIVASWVPNEPFRAGEERVYRYRLITFDERLERREVAGGVVRGQSLAQVVRTRIGWDALPGQADPPPRSQRRVVLDFEGGPLTAQAGEAEVIALATTSSGEITDMLVHALPSGGRRATFALAPDGDRGADMRVQLMIDGQVVSETWSYLWEPARAR
jgi:glucans biosynthesis protein